MPTLNNPALSKQPIQDLENKAAEFLLKQDYKKAIELYKALWKQKTSDKYQEALKECYLGRTRELSDKALYKEAVILWENHCTYCKDCTHSDFYIQLLLASHSYAKAAAVYQKYESELSADIEISLDEKFAALLLSTNPELEQAFDSQSLLRKHLVIANQAITAFTQGKFDGVTEALGRIPFRSPYKHFCQFMKGLLNLTEDKEKALSFFQRIPENSPFFRPALAAHMTLLDPLELSTKLQNLSENEYRLFSTLKGYEADHFKVITKLKKQEQKMQPQVLFDLIIKHIALFDKKTAKRLCYRLLPLCLPSQKTFEKHFDALNRAEKEHLKALSLTISPQTRERPHHVWLQHENILAESQPDTPHTRRMRAMLLRKADHFEFEIEKAAPLKRILLEKSLELDPSDKQTYLKLISHYRKKGVQKKSLHWLEKALKTLPQDKDILILAIAIYQTGKNFKQAIFYAQKLIKSDPLSRASREMLVEIYLMQVQTLVCSKKQDEARKVFAAITQDPLVASLKLPSSLQLNAGLLEYTYKNYEGARCLIEQNFSNIDKNIDERIAVLMEASKFKIILAEFEKFLKLPPLAQLAINDGKHCLQVIQALEKYHQTVVGSSCLNVLVKMMSDPFKQAASYHYSEVELGILFKSLTNMKQYRLINCFLKIQIAQFPSSCLLTYYRINTKVKDSPEKISRADFNLLDRMFDKAEQEKDHKTASLIAQFLRNATAAWEEAEALENAPDDFFEAINEIAATLDPKDKDLFFDMFKNAVSNAQKGKKRTKAKKKELF